MAHPNYTKDALEGWQTILVFALLGLILALLLSFVQPLKYSSQVRLLILQDVGASVDAYTASRSEERIAENLATIVYTTTFFDQVMNAGFSINQDAFSEEDYKRRREWSRAVTATVSRGTGILTITAYHQDVEVAEQISRAIAFVLTQNVDRYTSGGNVNVNLVDAPLLSRWPVKPNVLINLFSGFILGGFAGVGYILLQAERLRRRHQFVHE